VSDIHCRIDPAVAGQLTAILRGSDAACAITDVLVDAAVEQAVDPVLACSTAASSAPPPVAARLKALFAGHAILAAARDAELARVLACLAAAGIDVLVFKGAHLAQTLYAAPGLRPRADSDLLVAEDDRAAVEPVLTRAGYERLPHVRGSIILGQCHFRRVDRAGITHAIDVHWRIAAPLVLTHALPLTSVRASAVSVPALGPHALGPSRPDALLISCLHLAAHHRHDAILLWLHDIALLAEALDADERARFLQRAGDGHVYNLCAAAIDAARRLFDSSALAILSSELRTRLPRTDEPAARLLATRRPIDDLWLDLCVAERWRDRAALLREHLCPDVEYMRATQPRARWLAVAYARRAIRGLSKWTAVSGVDRRTAEPDAPTADSEEACASPCGPRTIR